MRYECLVCGTTLDEWRRGWQWYGRIDDPPEKVVCSAECRTNTETRATHAEVLVPVEGGGAS